MGASGGFHGWREEQEDQGCRPQEHLEPSPMGVLGKEQRSGYPPWRQKSEVRVSPMVAEGLCDCQIVILGLLAQKLSFPL